MSNREIISQAVAMVCKAVVLAALWAGAKRRRGLEQLLSMPQDELFKEVVFLREKVSRLEEELAFYKKQLRKGGKRPRYSVKERLFVLFQMAYWQIPRRRVKEHFGVSRSSLYRWIHRLDDAAPAGREPANKTPAEIVQLVWEIYRSNVDWGRHKIANQLKMLGVFIADTTVRNILRRPKPRKGRQGSSVDEERPVDIKPRSIPAFYPNHVWSCDLTEVFCWGMWKTYVLVAIDHFSRKVLSVIPLDGPNAGWTIHAMEETFRRFGPPKHMITDRGSVFASEAFRDVLRDWGVKQRFGAVGKHGSIAVTERVIETLKYEWLRKVPILRGISHLERLSDGFTLWYNSWRPHMTLDGFRPDDYYARDIPEPVPKDAKSVPANIERKVFEETGIVGFRLKDAA